MSLFCPINNCELCWASLLFALLVEISGRIFCRSWAAWVELECSFYGSLFKHESFSLMLLYIWIFVQGSWSSDYLGFGIDFHCWRFWVQDPEVWRKRQLVLESFGWVPLTVFAFVTVLTYHYWSWGILLGLLFLSAYSFDLHSVAWFLWWSLGVSNWIIWLVIL